jgi:hypothetical protein
MSLKTVLRAAGRSVWREVGGGPLARVLCSFGRHSRSKRFAFQANDGMQTVCRRCRCVLVRDANGVWHEKPGVPVPKQAAAARRKHKKR